MKKVMLAALAACVVVPTVAPAQVYVPGYVRSDGKYVSGHYRSNPNSSTFDNYSTKPNYNPYNGRAGTVDPFKSNTMKPYEPYKAPCYFNCPK